MFGLNPDRKPKVDKIEHTRGDTRKLAKVVGRKLAGGVVALLIVQNTLLLPAWTDNADWSAKLINVLGFDVRADATVVASK